MAYKIVADGIPSSMNQRELMALFTKFGPVLSVRIIETTKGGTTRIAEIEMMERKDVEKAVKGLHRTQMDGKILLVFAV